MMTVSLIAVNVAVSLLAFAAFRNGAGVDRYLMAPADVIQGRNFRGLIASQFSHADPGHLLFNMITLYFFGPVVEAGLGSAAMLMVYAAAGAASSLLVLIIHRGNPRYRSLGASGSISGIVFASIVLRPEMNIFLFFVPLPIPGPIFALGYVVLSSALALRQRPGISHEAHVGGAIAGFLLAGAMSPFGFSSLIDRIRQAMA